jgi:hypothetical protein
MLEKLTLKKAMSVVQYPEGFLATYFAVKDGAVPALDWLRLDGGKVILVRRGCLVQLTTYGYP